MNCLTVDLNVGSVITRPLLCNCGAMKTVCSVIRCMYSHGILKETEKSIFSTNTTILNSIHRPAFHLNYDVPSSGEIY
jgi:hypothetical protein